MLPNQASTDGQTDRWTDGQGDSSISPLPYFVAGGIIITDGLTKQQTIKNLDAS